jgi:hypothetical protein
VTSERPGMVWVDEPYGRWVAVEDIEDAPVVQAAYRELVNSTRPPYDVDPLTVTVPDLGDSPTYFVDELRAPGTDDFIGLQVERPRSGMLLLYALGAALLLAGVVLFLVVGQR